METKTILIIDDEPLILEVASSILKSLGYHSIATEDPIVGKRESRETFDWFVATLETKIKTWVSQNILSSEIKVTKY